MNAYTPEQVQEALVTLHQKWISIDDTILQLSVQCSDFDESMSLVNHIAKLANAADHHPDMHIHYDTVIIELSTHDTHGITDKDISLAKRIEAIL